MEFCMLNYTLSARNVKRIRSKCHTVFGIYCDISINPEDQYASSIRDRISGFRDSIRQMFRASLGQSALPSTR